MEMAASGDSEAALAGAGAGGGKSSARSKRRIGQAYERGAAVSLHQAAKVLRKRKQRSTEDSLIPRRPGPAPPPELGILVLMVGWG